jgi:alanyl-tRNA synthetase
VIPGDVAFQMYDTFGMPYEFIEDTAATQGNSVDREGYDRAMAAQRTKARAGSAFGGGAKGGDDFTFDEARLTVVGDQFEGYTTTQITGVPIVALFDEARQPVDTLASGQHGYVALARTPFYLESGGQVSDTGRLLNEATGASAVVEGVARIRPGLARAHRVRVDAGALHERDIVTAEVEANVRNATRRNHTATHLLHAALRQVLGTHVHQKGSLVAPDRLRFDFVHFQPVARDELDRIERIVNEQVSRNMPVTTDVRSTDEAIAAGAMALFGEKYGDQVRVVSVPGFSMELCGGTHVSATGDIGFFTIVDESGVAAGVRRIEAVTAAEAVARALHHRAALDRIVRALNVGHEHAEHAVVKLHAEVKRLTRETTELKTRLAAGGGGASGGDDLVEVAGVTLVRRKVRDLDRDALRGLADSLKATIKTGVVILASEGDGKVHIVVSVTADLTGRLKAGQVVKELAPIVGGGGGGRPDFAEAGGKQPERIDEMLRASEGVVARLLS